MDFGEAIKALKAGERVARSGWNGKGMFLYYVPANKYPAQTKVAKEYWGERQPPKSADPQAESPGILVPYGAYIAMKPRRKTLCLGSPVRQTFLPRIGKQSNRLRKRLNDLGGLETAHPSKTREIV